MKDTTEANGYKKGCDIDTCSSNTQEDRDQQLQLQLHQEEPVTLPVPAVVPNIPSDIIIKCIIQPFLFDDRITLNHLLQVNKELYIEIHKHVTLPWPTTTAATTKGCRQGL